MTSEEGDGSEASTSLSADLEDRVSFWAKPGGDGQTGVSLEGTIHNSGTEDVFAIVHIKVFDGKDWRNFTENAGVVPAGGDTGFYWDQGLGPVDENAVVVEYEVSRGSGNAIAESKPPPAQEQKVQGKTKTWGWNWRKGSS